MASKTINKYEKNFFFKLFFSFLFFYSIIFILLIFIEKLPNYCQGDECTYFENVRKLFLLGTYQDPLTERFVPPMHSIYIAPMVLLDLGRRGVIFLNLIISSLTISLTYLTSRFYFSNKSSLIISIVYGLYFIKYQYDFTALTEPFATFLLLFFSYIITKFKFTRNKNYLYFSGIILGFLLLQRPIFIYVAMLLGIISAIIIAIKKRFFNIFISLLIAFSITIPFQVFTYKITGKFLFFSNLGGEAVYWMSTPFAQEYGDWNNENFDSNCQSELTKGSNCNNLQLIKNHGEFFESIKNLNMVEKNDVFIKKGIENIKSYPVKYLRNIFSNIGRLLYNYPGSYLYQRDITLLRIIPNSIIFNLIIFSILITGFNFKKIPKEMLFLISFSLIYLILSSLITAYARMFIVIVPYILIWGSYTIKIWKNN